LAARGVAVDAERDAPGADEGDPETRGEPREDAAAYVIGGHVVDPAGKALSDVRVRWEPPPGTDPPEQEAATASRADGAWSLPTRVAPGGGGRLTLELADFVTGVFPNGPVAPLGPDRVCVLVPRATLRVHVRDRRGDPVPGADVKVASAAAERGTEHRLWPWLEWEGATDGSGAVVLDVAAGGPLEATIGARGFLTERATVRADDPVDVVLRPSARIRLRVVDEATGRPLAAAAELHREEPAPGRWIGSSACVEGCLAFERDVGEGTYAATIRKYGWQRTSLRLRVGPDVGTLDQPVRLPQEEGFRCVSLALAVEGGSAASVEGKTVHVFRRPAVDGPDPRSVADGWMRGHSFEDAVDGRVTFAVPTDRRCDLFLVAPTRNLVGIVEHLASNETERGVALRPGASFFATPSHWGVRARMRELRVVSRELGTLPSCSLEEGAVEHRDPSAPEVGQRFGPYPADAVVVVLDDDGRAFSIPVAEAAK
jgi:hypothetical protein